MIPWNYKNENKVFMNREKNGVPYLSFTVLEETGLVLNGFSTRLGGASRGKYATMNFAWNKGDDPADVLENYTRMAEALGADRDRMVASQQTHTTNVRLVTEKDAGKGVVKGKGLHRCGRTDHQCSGAYSGNLLCRLCTSVFSGSET